MWKLPLVLVGLFPAQAAELLPPAPEGWRHERLDLPLSFAPELEYEGFEELWFAPGMFQPDSDSYFSYAFAIQLVGQHHVDVAFLEHFLTGYYVGLCRAVGGSRGLELDLDAIEVDARRSPSGFVCTIDLFDAFTTGAELRLGLDVRVHPGPATTELFALASALGPDEPIWNELRAIERAWVERRPPAALFNHLYFVPDAESFAALESSAFLREQFGVFEQRRTVRADLTYEGLYFYGRRTYFEFLRPDPASGFQPGDSGLAFGFEQPGGTRRAAAALQQHDVQVFAAPASRELDGEQVPWFEMLGVQKPDLQSRFTLFSLEYVPGFLERWHADLLPHPGGIDRGSVLQRYASLLGRQPGSASAPLLDVVEVQLTLSASELARWHEVCDTFGFNVRDVPEGQVFQGPGMRYVVSAADTPGGVTALRLGLARPVERAPLVLGRLELRFEGPSALFRLRP